MAFQGNLFSPKAPKLPLEKQGITNPQSMALSTGKGLLQGRTAGGLAAILLSIPSTVWFCRLVPAHASHLVSTPPSLRAPSPPGWENMLLSELISYAPASALTTSFPFVSSFFTSFLLHSFDFNCATSLSPLRCSPPPPTPLSE